MASGRIKNPESIDALDIALARSADSSEARALIEKQSRLIDTQEELARTDMRHRGWQIIGERVGAMLKAMTVIVGLLVLFGITSFFWTAHKANGMVMDPFSVPPTMERQGLSGAVVAQQLLDKIAALEMQTQSARAASSYENSLSDSKGVVVPYAGVSLGELRREARDWLGSENHVSGDVVQLAGGRVAINYRTLGQSGRVEGLEKDFDALLQQAAQQVFKATQPYRYGIWRSRDVAPTAELREIFTALTRSTDPREVAWGYHGLANGVATSNAERRAYYEKAFAARPNFLPAYSNLPYYFAAEGQDEAAHRAFAKSSAVLGGGADDYAASHAKHYSLSAQSNLADYEGDFTAAARLMSESSGFVADSINTAFGPFSAAAAWAKAHDFPSARAQLAAAGYLDPQRRAEAEKIAGPQESVDLLRAMASDNYPSQAQGWTALMRTYQAAADAASEPKARKDLIDSVSSVRPALALSLARSGRLAEARAAITPLSNDDDRALRIRAFIAALARDPAADRMFAAAAARMPSLPAAQMLWAEAKVRTGDAAGAIEHAAAAAKLGPNAADNLYWWGKALMAQGKAAEAAAKFAEAARHTPHWGALHLDWAGALWQSGKRGAAVERLRAASNMALSPPDKARLMAMVRSANRQIVESRQ
ncbi:MAG: hypothetical protein ABIR87_01170 [Sphingomicrobium sp.]